MRSECLCATYKRDRPYGNTTNLASEFKEDEEEEEEEKGKRGGVQLAYQGNIVPIYCTNILHALRPFLNSGKDVYACNDLESKVERSTRGRIQSSQSGI